MAKIIIFALIAIQFCVCGDDLEFEVWTRPHSYATENKIVRLVQTNPRDAFAHYLLTVNYLKLLEENPLSSRILKKAGQIAQQAYDLEPAQSSLLALYLVANVEENESGMDAYLKKMDPSDWRYRLALSTSAKNRIEVLEPALNARGANRELLGSLLVNEYLRVGQTQRLEELAQTTNLVAFKIAMMESLIEKRKFAEARRYCDPRDRLWESEMRLFCSWASNEALKSLTSLSGMPGRLSVAHHFAIATLNPDTTQAAAYLAPLLRKTQGGEFLLDRFQKYVDHSAYVDVLEALARMDEVEAYIYGRLAGVAGDPFTARTNYRKASILDPINPNYPIGLGLAEYQLGNFKDAYRSLQNALSLDPANATIYYNAACVLVKLGRTKEAVAQLETAFKLDEHLKNVAAQDQDLALIFGH